MCKEAGYPLVLAQAVGEEDPLSPGLGGKGQDRTTGCAVGGIPLVVKEDFLVQFIFAFQEILATDFSVSGLRRTVKLQVNVKCILDYVCVFCLKRSEIII